MTKVGYEQVKRYVLDKIQSREWPPGEMIPSEIELAKEFNCARATVNRALAELVDEKRIDRKRKVGSRVLDGKERTVSINLQLPCREIVASGAKHRYDLLNREVVPLSDLETKNDTLASDDVAIYLEGLHFANDEACQFEQTWVNCKIYPQAREHDFAENPPCSWLLEMNPFFDGSMRLFASAANILHADCFSIEVGTPIFVKEIEFTHATGLVARMRTYYQQGYSLTANL